MSRSSSILVVAALFLSGVAIGALGMHLYYWQKLGARHPRGPAPSPMMVGWMERELELSPAQSEEIRAILVDSMRQSGEIRRELRPRVEALMLETAERISEVLDPEQRRRFEEFRSSRRHLFERGLLGPPSGPGRMRGRHGPPMPPPPPPDEDL